MLIYNSAFLLRLNVWNDLAAQDAQDAVLRFLKFSVSVALTRRLRFFEVFLRFSGFYAIYKLNRGFEIFQVFIFNRTDKVFDFFLNNGDSGYNTIRRGPQAGGHQGSISRWSNIPQAQPPHLPVPSNGPTDQHGIPWLVCTLLPYIASSVS